MNSLSPLIVISAPNGARITKEHHNAVPLLPEELADEAEQLLDVGVSVLHLHVRDNEGKHCLDIDRYKAAIKAIESRVGEQLLIQVTTEAVGCYDRFQQMELVRGLKPEAVSMALNELCPNVDALNEAKDFFHEVHRSGIWGQYILYSPEEVAKFETFRQQGVFGTDRPFALFVLGRYTNELTGDPNLLTEYLRQFTPGSFPWAVCCFGKSESDAMLLACKHGGHVRMGFENNIWLPNDELADNNVQLIKQTLVKITNKGCLPPLATACWLREQIKNNTL